MSGKLHALKFILRAKILCYLHLILCDNHATTETEVSLAAAKLRSLSRAQPKVCARSWQQLLSCLLAHEHTDSVPDYDLSHYNQSTPAFVQSAIYDIVYGWYTNNPVNGTETIAGYYCEPTAKNENSTKLQLMFHSITANRDYWSAMGGEADSIPRRTCQV